MSSNNNYNYMSKLIKHMNDRINEEIWNWNQFTTTRRIMLNRHHAHVPKASHVGKKSVKDPMLVGLFDTHPVKRVRTRDYEQLMVSFPTSNP